MFEFFGVIVAILIGWAAIKTLVKAAIRVTLQKAEDYAVTDASIPREFAQAVCANPPLLKSVRSGLAHKNREFAALGVYQQYGKAIEHIFDAHTEAEQLKEEAEYLLRPQLRALQAEGENIFVDDITFAYVGALALVLSRKEATDLQQVKNAVAHVFREEQYGVLMDNAFSIVLGSSDFFDKMAKLVPLARKELTAGVGDYFGRYTRHANRERANRFKGGPRVDLREVPADYFLNV